MGVLVKRRLSFFQGWRVDSRQVLSSRWTCPRRWAPIKGDTNRRRRSYLVLLHGVRQPRYGPITLGGCSWFARFVSGSPSPTLFPVSLVPRPCREVDLHRSGTRCCLRSSRRASNLSFRGVGCLVNGEEGTRGWPCTWATGTQQCPAVWLVHEPTVLCFSLYSPLTPPVASFKYTDKHYSDRAQPIFSLTVYICRSLVSLLLAVTMRRLARLHTPHGRNSLLRLLEITETLLYVSWWFCYRFRIRSLYRVHYHWFFRFKIWRSVKR